MHAGQLHSIPFMSKKGQCAPGQEVCKGPQTRWPGERCCREAAPEPQEDLTLVDRSVTLPSLLL